MGSQAGWNPNPRWIENYSPRLQFESMWLVAQKFGYLNGLSANGLRIALSNSSHPLASDSLRFPAPALFRRIQQRRQARQGPDVHSDFLRTRGPLELFGSNSEWLCDLSRIRYCPDCMDLWFHSTLYQVAAVHVCPLHAVPLISTCRHCDRAMPSFEIESGKGEFFQCAHCKQPYSKKPISLEALFLTSEELKPIQVKVHTAQKEIEEICKGWRLENRIQLDLLRHAHNQSLIRERSFEMLWVAANAGAKLPDHCCARFGLFTSFFSSTTGPVPGRDDEKPAETPIEVLARLRLLAAQIKSMGRHFRRVTWNVCRHTKALRPDFGYDLSNEGRRHFLLFAAQDCHCCAALAMWRAEYCLLFAIIRRIEARLQRGKRIDVEILTRRMSTLNFNAAAAYAAFGWAVFFYADCRGIGSALRPSLQCVLDDSLGQIYRSRGMPWVGKGDSSWIVVSVKQTVHICLKGSIILNVLRELYRLPPKEDICIVRWSPEVHGIWHQELAENNVGRGWTNFGLL